MEAITGQSGDAAGMDVVTLNLGELIGTWGQKCSDVKIIHGFLSTSFFPLKKGASSFKLLVRISEALLPGGRACWGAHRTLMQTLKARFPWR